VDLRNAIFTGAKVVDVDFTRAIADEHQFDANQLSNKQREQLGFSVEITVKQTTPEQTGEKQAKYGEARYGQDMYGGKGGQEAGGKKQKARGKELHPAPCILHPASCVLPSRPRHPTAHTLTADR